MGEAGLRGKEGWAGLFAVGGRRGYGMMTWQRSTNGLRPAIDRAGCWRIGVGDVYHYSGQEVH